jgi:hypothetical protein
VNPRPNALRPLAVPAALLAGLAVAPEAGAQVLRELPAVELVYAIRPADGEEPVGSAELSFRPTDTSRGRRLRVEAHIQYVLTEGRETPFEYSEQATLTCDGEGVTKFETVARALGKERQNTGVRIGDDFMVTTRFEDEQTQKTITAGVRRTNFGLFCAGYLAEPLGEQPVLTDFPLLFPVAGDHGGRQKFQLAIEPVRIGERSVSCIHSRINRPNRTRDHLWNSSNALQILVRMEESTNQGKLVYELTQVNGVPAAESGMLD